MTQYDLNSAEFIANPYPVYEQLRANEPVYWSPENSYWLLTRYADIVSLIQHPQLSSNRIGAHASRMPEPAKEHFRPFFSAVSSWMLMVDPPDHTRLRGLVNKAFTPSVVENMRSLVENLVDETLDRVKPTGRMDIMTDLANSLPATVIAEMLGVQGTDQDEFKQWSDDISMALSGIDTAKSKEELLGLYELAQASLVHLSSSFRARVETLRRAPQGNLLSALIEAEEQGDRLSEEELFANCVLLMLAGHETTTNLIGSGMLALLQHPAEKERLLANPAAIASAVEEFLRFESPVQKMGRIAAADTQIGGKTIKQGDLICLCFGAANRDAEQFVSPATLDIERKPNRHLAFGHGLHYCVGAALARLEGQIAINKLLERLPNLELVSQKIEWLRSSTLRGLKSLPVSFNH